MSRPSVRAARHVSLARVLHRRLYLSCDGRVVAVSGRIAHCKLKQTLAHYERVPTAAEAPSPPDLGIPGCDGELSPQLLHSMYQALNRWRKDLSVEARRRPAKRRAAVALARERREIERLESRLKALNDWRARLMCGAEPPGAPFFLDGVAETALQAAIENAEREHPLTPLIAWQARLVLWLSGECAAKRFLSATTQLLAAHCETAWLKPIRSFQQAVIVWKRRGEEEASRNLLREIAQRIRSLPPEVVRHGRFSARLRNRTFLEHCEFLLQTCSKLLTETQRRRWRLVPAALAALTAADGSAIALPLRCFREAVEGEDHAQFTRTVDELAEQIGQRGYDALLIALDRLPVSPCEIEFAALRRLLARGDALADSVWACQQRLAHTLAESCLSVRALRRLAETFARRGCPLNSGDLSVLIGRLPRRQDLQPVHAWLAWLGSVSRRTITPRLQKTLHAAFWNRYLPSVQKRAWFEQLACCLAAPRRAKPSDDCQPLFERITAQQRLAGKTQTLPKSLRKLLDHRERRQRERETLRALQAAGVLDRAAQARLEYLENDADALPDAGKLRRVAEEAFLLSGIESLRFITRKLAEAACRARLGGLFRLFSPEEYWQLACRIDAMSESECACLQELIAAHDRYGRDYRRHLAANQPWIAKASFCGIDLDRWFAAEPHAVEIGGRTMEIELAGELQHVFRMGAYFKTCLSFGGCNEMSVLANAYDANKQVVFMFGAGRDGQRQVIARQLIAVSSDFQLLRYCCYVHARRAETGDRQEIMDAMAVYCARLAAECGLELADEGTPRTIGDHFWYDDGECEWPDAARTARAAIARPALAGVAN